MLIGKLNAKVSPYTERANSRKRTLTTINVCLGTEVICTRTIPGNWDEKQALTEFRRFPERFTKTEKYAALDLKTVAAA